MQAATPRPSRFPLIFEALIWVVYVGLYKYAAYTELIPGSVPGHPNFPYPHLCVYAFLITLYTIPYYRWLVPQLLHRRWYLLLLAVTLLYFWFVPSIEFVAVTKLFRYLAAHGFDGLATLPRYTNLSIATTDLIAFSCVAFVRQAFEQEARRRQIEHEHAALQLEQLKAQLQPHFLFNTLNSIYGLSLAGSPDTPRFILLLSELMRYVLYDSGKEQVALADEVEFLQNYFELEQRKYAGASVLFRAELAGLPAQHPVPPLLWLPLVENSFKHGRHHLTDDARVAATLTATPGGLRFVIENDMLPAPPPAAPRRSGGIGLANLRRRLGLYYPGRHQLTVAEHEGRYRAELFLQL